METTLKIEGMTCGHCVRAVQNALEAVPGATVEAVQIGEARVRIIGEGTQDALKHAVEAEGFRVTDVTTAL